MGTSFTDGTPVVDVSAMALRIRCCCCRRRPLSYMQNGSTQLSSYFTRPYCSERASCSRPNLQLSWVNLHCLTPTSDYSGIPPLSGCLNDLRRSSRRCGHEQLHSLSPQSLSPPWVDRVPGLLPHSNLHTTSAVAQDAPRQS